MALPFGFDDDLFSETNIRSDKPISALIAKQCEHLWFMNDSASNDADDNEKLQCLLYQGNVLFHQGQWMQALKPYHAALQMTSKKVAVVYRMLSESLSRCYVNLGNEQLAKKYAIIMVNESQNDDQRATAQSLMATVFENFSNTKEEIECLQKCVQYHPMNARFWFRLAKAYLKLSKSSNSSSVMKNTGQPDTGNKENSSPHSAGISKQCVSQSPTSEEISRSCIKLGAAFSNMCVKKPEYSTSRTACSANETRPISTLVNGHDETGKSHGAQQSKLTTNDTSTSNSVYSSRTYQSTNKEQTKPSKMDGSSSIKSTLKQAHDGTRGMDRLCVNGEERTLQSDDENTELSVCLCDVKDSLHQVPLEERLRRLPGLFAAGCLIRCSALLSTVQHSVMSFVKEKNTHWQEEIKTLLESLDLDRSFTQQLTEHTDDVLYDRKGGQMSGILKEEVKSNGSTNDIIVLLTIDEFEHKWFPWAFT